MTTKNTLDGDDSVKRFCAVRRRWIVISGIMISTFSIVMFLVSWSESRELNPAHLLFTIGVAVGAIIAVMPRFIKTD